MRILKLANRERVRRRTGVWLAGVCLCLAASAHAKVLWQSPDWRLIRNNEGGRDLLAGKVSPHDDTSSGTLYFKFEVDPYSDSVVEYPGNYEAGMVLYEGGQPRLGVGNAWAATAYSAFNVSSLNPQNSTPGEFDLHSRRPEHLKIGDYEVPRRGVVQTIVFKVRFIPGGDDEVTIWLSPNLWPGSREETQALNSITRLKANASFDELRLSHRGTGKGWKFGNLAVATEFDDFVDPYPWEKWWVISGGALTLAALVAGGAWLRAHRRMRRIRGERERLRQLNAVERERRRIARDIHDDLGSTLWEIHFLSKLGDKGGPPQTREELELIASKALESTRALDEIVWAVDPEADTLESFINYSCAFATEHLGLANVACRLDIPSALPALPLHAEMRHNLFMAFKEALTNIIKHARATQVHIRMALDGPVFSIELTDNGRGLPPATPADPGKNPPKGRHGLANMRERLAALGGECHISPADGQGTRVRLQIMTGAGDNASPGALGKGT